MTSPSYKHLLVVPILSMLLCVGTAMADAIMRSQAMFADTIAEYYVEDDHVRLELEIGTNDVAAFRNLDETEILYVYRIDMSLGCTRNFNDLDFVSFLHLSYGETSIEPIEKVVLNHASSVFKLKREYQMH